MAKQPWEVVQHPCTNKTCHVHLPYGLDDETVNSLMAQLQVIEGVNTTANVAGEHIEVGMSEPSVLDHIKGEVKRFQELTPALT